MFKCARGLCKALGLKFAISSLNKTAKPVQFVGKPLNTIWDLVDGAFLKVSLLIYSSFILNPVKVLLAVLTN